MGKPLGKGVAEILGAGKAGKPGLIRPSEGIRYEIGGNLGFHLLDGVAACADILLEDGKFLAGEVIDDDTIQLPGIGAGILLANVNQLVK